MTKPHDELTHDEEQKPQGGKGETTIGQPAVPATAPQKRAAKRKNTQKRCP
jgi:hypothetical protein